MDTQYQPQQNSFSPEDAPAQAPAQQMPAPQFNQPPQAPKMDDKHKLKGSTVLLLLLVLLALVVGISVLIKKSSDKAGDIGQQASVPPSSVLNYQNYIQGALANDDDVKALQTFLTEKGFYTGPINGDFGNSATGMVTINASKAYKTSINVKPMGGQFGPGWQPATGTLPSGTSPTGTDFQARCTGDFDGDGEGDIDDFVALLNHYTTALSDDDIKYDLTNDGQVDSSDMFKFMNRSFGRKSVCSYITSTTNTIPTGTDIAIPSAVPVPEGSDWSSSIIPWVGDNAWAWSYKPTKVTLYESKQTMNGAQTQWVYLPASVVNSSSTGFTPLNSLKKWYYNGNGDVEPIHPYTYSVKMINSKQTLVVDSGELTYPDINGGLPFRRVYHIEFAQLPAPAQNLHIQNFDIVLRKVGDVIENKTYVNRKPIEDYTTGSATMVTNLPPYSATIPANGSVMQNPLARMWISDQFWGGNVAGFDFPSFTDDRLESVNLVEGPIGYDPDTNTFSGPLTADDTWVNVEYIYDPNTTTIFNAGEGWTEMPWKNKGAFLNCSINIKTGFRKFCN